MSYSRRSTINCENNPNVDCTIEASLSILGGKWKLKIYKVLRAGHPLRFKDIKDRLDPISDKTLTAQLREMEEDSLIIREVFPVVPPKVEYQLTDLGKSLEEIFLALEKWGKTYINQR
ncbi:MULTISPECIES: winged helix-turn-helix transcriptional regulator [Sphingobacterium]|uniref:winged helix-turn-helix transcriptional regulator n=1 Tax=Sphingobacterium TaxID=28453 RepID=UPI0015578A60|nr:MULTISPECIES: helix-turn-helix domain-containing protein [Sphingobacterium]NPE45736.1 helix-turn-helix transcriptional regulator [Sphingobacterium prati]